MIPFVAFSSFQFKSNDFFFSQWLKFLIFLPLYKVSGNSCQELLYRWWGFDRVGFPIGNSHVFSVYAVCLWEEGRKKNDPFETVKFFWKLVFHKKNLNYSQDFLEVFWDVYFIAFSLENEAAFPKFSSWFFNFWLEVLAQQYIHATKGKNISLNILCFVHYTLIMF